MLNSELISVIIPIYNMEKYLSKCIDSVIKQTYKNLEIILVDDGSTDGSAQICDEYCIMDKRCIVIHQDNQGLVMARRNGLAAAKGKYVGFVDSDDWIDIEMYEYLYEQICKYKVKVVTTGRYIEAEKRFAIKDNIPPGLYSPISDAFFCKHMIMGEHKVIWGITPNFWNKLFLKDYLMKWQNRVDEKITYGEDDACVYPCMAFAEKVYVSDKCFYHYRLRETSMSNSTDDYYFARINLLYVCLKDAFENHPFADILIKELGIYMVEFVIRGLNDFWGLNSGIVIPRNWMNLSGISKKADILLYGAGKNGKDFYKLLCFLGLARNIVWVDINYKELSEQGYPVYSLMDVKIKNINKAIITIGDRRIMREAKKTLIEAGVSAKMIYWCRATNVLEALLKGEYINE